MDAAHIHLVLTHVPIVGVFFGICILLYGILSKNDLVKKIALVIFIAMSIITIPVFLTGEEAEHTVENLQGVNEAEVEVHEELAEKAIWPMGLLGILSIAACLSIRKQLASAQVIVWLTLIVSVFTFGLFAQVGNLGGQIRHSEIRNSALQNPNEVNQGRGTGGGNYNDSQDDDDDDDDDD